MAPVNRKLAANKTRTRSRGESQSSESETQRGQVTKKENEYKENKNKSFISKCCGWLKYFVLFMLIPPFLNYAALHQEQRFLQLPDTMYDVGNGQKISFRCEGTGKPTVVLESPTGTSSDVWSSLISSLSEVTKVCVYDRAGLGFSERPVRNRTMEKEASTENEPSKMRGRGGIPFTVESMVDNLKFLTTYSSQQVDKPFIYVGSELGALVARFYTQIYEMDVSDLVLVDPLVETLFEEDEGVWTKYWFNHIIPSYQTMQLAAATGLTRIALMLNLIEAPLADGNIQDTQLMKQKHLLCHPRHLSTVVDEHHFINESFSQMQTVFVMKSFPANVSVTVITGNYYDEQLPSSLNKAWAKSQQNLISKIHPGSHHIVVNGADRKMIYKQPEALLEPIKRLIRKRSSHMNAKSS